MDSSFRDEMEDDRSPLWKYVTKLERTSNACGNCKFKCNYCLKVFTGTYSRVKSHLLRLGLHGVGKCTKLTPELLSEMKKVSDEVESKLKNSKAREVPLPSSHYDNVSKRDLYSSTSTNMDALGVNEPRKRKAGIDKAFDIDIRADIDSDIARMFYSAGLPFTLARNPHFSRSYSLLASSRITEYVPPGYNKLRTTLLQNERSHIERMLVPIRNSWKENGVSIICDGWTDPQRRPLINFMAVTENGPMFLKAVNTQGEYKYKYYISELIKCVIGEVGPDNVIQVITDNAPVCRAAGALVETQYPHIFWTPCVVHTLNLALKNICAAKNTEVYDECSWITVVANDAVIIKKFIMNHSMRLAMFNKFVNLKMLSVADTRFASVIIMLRRFKAIKCGLQTMMISDEWSLYREDNSKRAAFVKEKILDDLWWEKVDYIISFSEPIYEMLRVADTERPSLHLIYDMWDSMIEKVKAAIYKHEKKKLNEESSFWSVVFTILVARWSKSCTPIHCLAHSLNPRFYSSEWLKENPYHVAPHMDHEISKQRIACLMRYFPNIDECRVVNTEFGLFSTSLDHFSEQDSMLDRGILEAKIWWAVHGSSTPLLCRLALKLLRQPSSSSCCERNWSTYSFVNSVKRNNITPQRAEDLVYVHSNLRLLSRRTPEYHVGKTKMLDVGGDAFDSMESNGVLEIANLSLDEPDLESILFVDDIQEGPVST